MSTQPFRPRVLLADDDVEVRTAVSRFLLPDCDVVGYVADCSAVVEETLRLRPDVVLLDLSLEGSPNALEVCRHIKTVAPHVHVVVFTAHDDEEFRLLADEAGASGFVSKLRVTADLLPVIHALVESSAIRQPESVRDADSG